MTRNDLLAARLSRALSDALSAYQDDIEKVGGAVNAHRVYDLKIIKEFLDSDLSIHVKTKQIELYLQTQLQCRSMLSSLFYGKPKFSRLRALIEAVITGNTLESEIDRLEEEKHMLEVSRLKLIDDHNESLSRIAIQHEMQCKKIELHNRETSEKMSQEMILMRQEITALKSAMELGQSKSLLSDSRDAKLNIAELLAPYQQELVQMTQIVRDLESENHQLKLSQQYSSGVLSPIESPQFGKS